MLVRHILIVHRLLLAPAVETGGAMHARGPAGPGEGRVGLLNVHLGGTAANAAADTRSHGSSASANSRVCFSHDFKLLVKVCKCGVLIKIGDYYYSLSKL